MARLVSSFSVPLATFAVLLSIAVARPATAQLQGVQPIFNDQLGGWSAVNPNQSRRQGNQSPPGGGGGGGTTINVPYPWWGGNVWGPSWGYPYGYTYYPPAFGYSHFGGWRNWSVYNTQPVQPIIVVQPQIVMPPAAANPAAGVGAMPAPAIANRAGGVMREDLEIARRAAALKASNEAGRMRADQLIAEGDREFAKGDYRRAALKYRDAINRAQDYATAYFRAGHAYTAHGDFELAVTYFAMALELSRTPDRGGFTLDSLYRGDDAAKVNHLRSLDVAAARQPLEGGLPFLTGLLLHYDGNPLQARDHFRRAADLPGRHRPYAGMFLPPEPKDPPDNAAGVKAP